VVDDGNDCDVTFTASTAAPIPITIFSILAFRNASTNSDFSLIYTNQSSKKSINKFSVAFGLPWIFDYFSALLPINNIIWSYDMKNSSTNKKPYNNS